MPCDTQPPVVSAKLRPPPTANVADRYLRALLAGDAARAERIVTQALSNGWSLADVYVLLLQHALYEVGRLWEHGQLSVAQEHVCTAITQQIMTSLHGRLFQTAKTGKWLLATSIGGNFHSVGIRMLADIFELDGWHTSYLGADAPAQMILDRLASSPHDVLAISAALDAHVPSVAALIVALRGSPLGRNLWIMVGGRAFNDDLELWREVGADGHAITPEGALRCAERGRLTQADPHPEPAPAQRLRVARIARANDPMLDAMSRLNSELNDMARTLAEKNAELAQLSAHVNRLMGIAAHDLRNPLAVIISNGQFLSEDLATSIGVDQREMLETIADSGAFMKRLLDDLLDVSQIRAGKLTLQREQVDVVAFTRKVVAMNGMLAQRKQITVHFTATQPAVELVVDRPKLQQVINNLVGNAVQYSPSGSMVEVTLTVDETEVVLSVRDRGRGIPATEVGKVFGVFETTTTRGTAGEKSTGLGLAIVQAIVQAHGGRIWLESVVDEGSCFFVSLPLG